MEDRLNIEELSKIYHTLEGRKVTFRDGGPPHLGTRFSSFNIYLNDSVNMERYIQRDLQGDPLMKGPKWETEVLEPGTPIMVGGLPGKSIKFKPLANELLAAAAYFNDGNHTYHIEYTDSPLSYRDEVFDHIVESFKFIPIAENIDTENSNDNEEDSGNDNEEDLGNDNEDAD